MQDHSTVIPSTPLSFADKEAHTKRNLAFVRELDSRMKNDIHAGRRKLFNSVTSTQIREVTYSNPLRQNQAFFRQNGNPRQLQHEKSNPDLANQLQRPVFSQIPEETDVLINKLIFELNQTKRQRDVLRHEASSKVQVDTQALERATITISQLQQIIKQNDFNARQAISRIQQQKEELRLKNEQMTLTFEHSFKTKNDKSSSLITETKPVDAKPCNRCQQLEQRIRQIETQIKALNSKYEKEVQKVQLLDNQKSAYLIDFQQKVSKFESKLSSSQQQISTLIEEKRQLETTIFKLRNAQTIPNDQYENLRFEYENLLQQNKRLQNNYESLSFQNSQIISQLNFATQKIYEIHLQISGGESQGEAQLENMLHSLEAKFNEYSEIINNKAINIAQLQSKLEEKEAKMKKFSEEFSEFREKAFYDQERYIRKIQEMQYIEKQYQTVTNMNEEYALQTRELALKNENLKQKVRELERFINQAGQQLDVADDTEQHLTQRARDTGKAQQRQYVEHIKSKLYEAEALLKEKEDSIQQIREQLKQTENFVKTVFSQQLEQQTNSINELLEARQALVSQNSELKSRIQRAVSLEEANQRFTDEISYAIQENQNLAEKNRELEDTLNAVYVKHEKVLLQKKLLQLQLLELRQNLDPLQKSAESPSKIRYSEEIVRLQQQLNASQQEVIRLKSISDQLNESIVSKNRMLQNLTSQLRQKTMVNQVNSNQFSKNEQFVTKIRELTQNNLHLQEIVNQQQIAIKQSRQHLELAEENLVQRETIITQMQIRFSQTEQARVKLEEADLLLREKDTAINQIRSQLEQAENFMQTVLSQQLQQQTNSINELLANRQALLNQNSELKGQAQKATSLEEANKRFLTEIDFMVGENQRLAKNNQELELALHRVYAQQQKNSHEKKFLQLQLLELRQHLEPKRTTESPSKSSQNQEIVSLQQQPNENWQEQKRLKDQSVQRYGEDLILLQQNYEQKLKQIQEQFTQKLSSETRSIRIQIESQFKRKLTEKEVTITSLSNSSEKYGEILIKYNTLNIDHQTFMEKVKLKEENYQKQINQFQLLLQETNKQFEAKVKEVEDFNRQLQLHNNTTYKNLQNAENYICELLEKLKYFENRVQRDLTPNVDLKSAISQATSQLSLRLNQEKQQIITRYQNEAIFRESIIKKYEIQINQTANLLKRDQYQFNELNKRLAQRQQQMKLLQSENKSIAELKQERNRLFNLYEELIQQNQQLKKTVQFQNNHIGQTQRIVARLDQELRTKNQEIKDLQMKYEIAKQQIPEFVAKDIQKLSQRIKQEQQTSQMLNARLFQQQQQNSSLRYKLKQLHQNEELLQKVQFLFRENEELRQQLQFKNDQIRRITEQLHNQSLSKELNQSEKYNLDKPIIRHQKDLQSVKEVISSTQIRTNEHYSHEQSILVEKLKNQLATLQSILVSRDNEISYLVEERQKVIDFYQKGSQQNDLRKVVQIQYNKMQEMQDIIRKFVNQPNLEDKKGSQQSGFIPIVRIPNQRSIEQIIEKTLTIQLADDPEINLLKQQLKRSQNVRSQFEILKGELQARNHQIIQLSEKLKDFVGFYQAKTRQNQLMQRQLDSQYINKKSMQKEIERLHLQLQNQATKQSHSNQAAENRPIHFVVKDPKQPNIQQGPDFNVQKGAEMVSKKIQEIARLEEELSYQRNQSQNLRSQLQVIKKLIGFKEKQIQQISEQKRTLMVLNQKLNNQTSEFKIRLQQSAKENTALQSLLNPLQQELRQQEQRYMDVLKQLENQKDLLQSNTINKESERGFKSAGIPQQHQNQVVITLTSNINSLRQQLQQSYDFSEHLKSQLVEKSLETDKLRFQFSQLLRHSQNVEQQLVNGLKFKEDQMLRINESFESKIKQIVYSQQNSFSLVKNQMQDQIKTLSQQLRAQTQQVEHFESKKKLVQQINVLEYERGLMLQDISILSEIKDKNQIEISNLIQQSKHFEQQLHSSAIQLVNKDAEIQSISAQLQELSTKNREISSYQDKIRELEKRNNSVILQLSKREQQSRQASIYVQQLKTAIAQLEVQLSAKISEISTLKSTLTQLETTSKSASRRKDRSEYKQGLSKVDQELSQSRRQLTGTESHIKLLQQAIIRAQQQIKSLNGHILDLENRSESGSKSDSPLKRIELQTEIQILRAQIQDLKVINDQSFEKIRTLELQVIGLTEENKKQIVVINQRNTENTKEIQEKLLEQVHFFKTKLDEAENYIFYMEKKIQDQKKSVISQNNSAQNEKLTKQIQYLENLLKEKDVLITSNKGKQVELEAMIKTLNQQKDLNKNKLTELENIVRVIEQQNVRLSKIELQTVKQSIQAKSKVNSLEKQIKLVQLNWKTLLQKQSKERQEDSKKIISLQSNVYQLQNKNRSKQAEIQLSKLAINSYEEKIITLNGKIVTLEENEARGSRQLASILAKLEQEERKISIIQQKLTDFQIKNETQQKQIARLTQENQRLSIEKQEQLAANIQELEFYKNKLGEAEEYIYRLQTQSHNEGEPLIQNEKLVNLQQQVLQLKTQLGAQSDTIFADLLQQVHKSKEAIRDLQSDKANITTKFNQSQFSFEAIKTNLSKVVGQAEIYTIEINRLKSQKLKIEETVSETKNELLKTEAELVFFRNKLSQAEDYIHYLESLRSEQENKAPFDLKPDQIERLSQQIKGLTVRNKELQNDKSKLIISLSSKTEELKLVNSHLQNYQLQLKQALGKVEFLQDSKKRADQKINEFKSEIQKVGAETVFFKDKLRQAENYINYLEDEKIKEITNKVPTQSKSSNTELIITIANLEALLKKQENQLETKIKQNEAEEKLIAALKRERESLVERVTYSENLLIGNVEKIQFLQNQLREVDQRLASRDIAPTQESFEHERIIQILKQKNQHLQQQLALSYRTIDQLKSSVTQEEVYLKVQPKSFAKNKFTQIPRQDELFFKKKLLQAESYIQQLQKQRDIVEGALSIAQTKLSKNQVDIQSLRKELLLAVSDKKILESSIVQLNRANQNLRESLKIATSQSNNTAAVQLSEENNRLRANLLQIEADSRLQIQNLSNKYQELKRISTEQKQKYLEIESQKAKLVQELQQSHDLVTNLEKKAKQTQKQIANLRLIKQDNEDLLAALSSLGNLKQTVEKIQERNALLENQVYQEHSKLLDVEKANTTLNAQLELLKNKLLSSQRFILQLEQELKQKQAQTTSDEKATLQKERFIELQQKYRQIEMKLILSDQKQRRYIETIQTQQTNLQIFKESLNNAEQQIEAVKHNIDSASKKTREDAEIIKNLQIQINRYGKAPEEQAAFFKGKLLQAESYISTLSKQNKDLKQTTGVKYENLVFQIESLNRQNQALEGELLRQRSLKQDAEENYFKIQSELQQLKDDLQAKVEETLNLAQQLNRAEILLQNERTKYVDDVNQLRKELIQTTHRVKELEQQNEKIEDQNEQRGEKIGTLEAELQQKSSQSDNVQNSQFFKEKLFEAEAFIKDLQDQNKALKLEVADFNLQMQGLKHEISKLKDKQILSQSQSLERSQIESKKLQQLKTAEHQITLVNSQNLQLKRKLQQIKIDQINQDRQSKSFEVNFLKDKLYEAQNYIVQLERQVEKLTNQNVDKEAVIKQAQASIEDLREKRSKFEAKMHQLQLQVQEANQRAALNQSLENNDQDLLRAQNEQIIALGSKLQATERELSEFKNEAREKNTLKQKLLQAEAYIIQLQRQNEGLNENIGDLNENMKKLELQTTTLLQKIDNADTEKLVLAGELRNLKEENLQLKDQVQKQHTLLLTRTVGTQEQRQRFSIILKEKQQLQSSFSEQKLKNNIELELLKNQLEQKARSLEATIQINVQLVAKNKQLEQKNSELSEEVKVQERSIDNISKSMTLKEEKLTEIEPLIAQLEAAQQQIARLQEQNNANYFNTSEMLDQINRISEENSALNEKLDNLSKIEEEDAVRTQEQFNNLKEEYQNVSRQHAILLEQVKALTHQLSEYAQQVQSLKNMIAPEQTAGKSSNEKVQLLQRQIANLTAKIESLQNIQRDFQSFKAALKQKEAAIEQFIKIQRQGQGQTEHRSLEKSHSSELKDNEQKPELLQLSLEQAKKQIENKFRQELNTTTKQLQSQIDGLRGVLIQKQQQKEYLQQQKLRQQQTLKDLQELNGHLLTEKQKTDEKLKVFEQLQQALIQVESQKLSSQQEIQKLRSELFTAFNTAEQGKKQKIGLQKQIESLRQELQSKAIILQASKEALRASQNANEDLQNKLKKAVLEYQEKIQSYNTNIKVLSNRLGQSQAKTEELQSKIKSIIIQEQPTEIQVPQREVLEQNNDKNSPSDYDRLQVQLQLEREQLILTESELQILKTRIQEYERENYSLQQQLDEKDRLNKEQIEKIDELMTIRLRQKEEILKQKELIEEDLSEAEKKISQKELQFEDKEQKIGSSIRKLIDITNNFHQEEGGDPTEVMNELQSFPYLNELITSILYRLRLASAIQLQKSLKIEALKAELQIYKAQVSGQSPQLVKLNDKLKDQNQKLRQSLQQLTNQNQKLSSVQPASWPSSDQTFQNQAALDQQLTTLQRQNTQLKTQLSEYKQLGMGSDKYDELLKQCADYQIHNNQLEQQLKEITEAHERLKEKLKEYEEQICQLMGSSQHTELYQQNLALKEKLSQSQRLASSIKDQDSSGSINTQQQFRLQFLHLCLNKVDQIQSEVRRVESEIQNLAQRDFKSNLASSVENKPEDSHLIERLQELQQQLLRNAENIREHHQRADGELYILLKELVNDEQIPAKSKQKIEDYLKDLEQQILRQYEQHHNEVAILKEQITRSAQKEGQFSDRSRENLLREIENLNNAIEIYHQETMRRKRVYKRVLQGLLQDVQRLALNNQTEDYTELARKIEQAIERNDEQDLEFDGQDFIITGGSGNVELLGEDLVQKQAQSRGKNKDSLAMQTEEDNKPFLKFLLSAQDIDREDLKLLKKKVAELRGREIEENMLILRNKEKKLEEVLQLTNKETSPQQIENIMVALANNYSRDEISQIFGSEDNDELINKLNQALCLQESFYRGLNSSILMQEIQERKRKYYETPTKLSEQVFKHLLGLLSAKKDEDFYEQVESLFRSMYEIQDGFEISLRKKDEIYRSHNQRMNQIFNRSSSDNSEDYLVEFQRGNVQEMQLQVGSERKPHRSFEGSDLEESPQKQ